jgi:hypothetical protein
MLLNAHLYLKKGIFMKVLVAMAVALVALVARAEVKYEVKEVNELSVAQGKLKVSYVVGGGCQKHTPVVEVNLGTAVDEVIVSVYDTSPAEDMCEALISQHAEIDLKSAVTDACAKSHEQCAFTTKKLMLPQVIYNP